MAYYSFGKVKKNTEISFETDEWNMFSVSLSRYDQRLLDIFRSILGREYNPEKKIWSFPNESYSYMFSKISELSEVEILQELIEEESIKVHAIIMKEDEQFVYIKIPHIEK